MGALKITLSLAMADVRLKGGIGYTNNAEIASRERSVLDRERSIPSLIKNTRHKFRNFAKFCCKVYDIRKC